MFVKKIFFGDTLMSNNILLVVMSGFIFQTNQSMMCLLFKTENMPKGVFRLVNTFVLHRIKWSMMNERLHHMTPNRMLLDVRVSPKGKP